MHGKRSSRQQAIDILNMVLAMSSDPPVPAQQATCPSCRSVQQERIAGLWLCQRCGHEWSDPVTPQGETAEERCLRCGGLRASSIHHIDSANDEIRNAAHTFMTGPSMLAENRGFERLIQRLGDVAAQNLARAEQAEADLLALRREKDEYKRIGQGFERDYRNTFEQSCFNLRRAEKAESDLNRTRQEFAALQREKDELQRQRDAAIVRQRKSRGR